MVLPPISAEWDPPIPEPPTLRPERPRTSIKSIVIPDDLRFEGRRLSAEWQAAYEALITPVVKAEQSDQRKSPAEDPVG